jgi:hypothetical protein
MLKNAPSEAEARSLANDVLVQCENNSNAECKAARAYIRQRWSYQ